MKNLLQSKNLFWNLTAMLIFIAVIYFLVVPVSRILLGSLQIMEGGAWTLENFLSFIKYRTYWRSLANSVGVSLAASALTIVLAVPLARLERIGIFVLLGLLFLLPYVGRKLGLEINLLQWLVWQPVHWLNGVFLQIGGLG